MNRRRLLRGSISAAIGAGGLLILVLVVGSWRSERRQRSEIQRLEIPREWARLAAYPETARDLRATTSGGPFTRAFRVSFSAPAADIEKWLKDSPGTREAEPTHPSPGKRHFAISPGGGAQHAEVVVDDVAGVVAIYVYWS
jgi:hypothetical protein